jgi:NAD(P)-dependent dehydrogenase (short-subunit alcohol dehydrogenase family)
MLDINDAHSIAAAVSEAEDVTILVNNAGNLPKSASILELTDADFRDGMETNFFGPVAMSRAFAPLLVTRRGSALVNVHSVASWYAFGGVYSASKAALWSATNALRLELAPRGVHVLGVHVGYVDTAMADHATGPKMRPSDLVRATLDALEEGQFEVIADELTAKVKAGLSGPVEALYPELLDASRTPTA